MSTHTINATHRAALVAWVRRATRLGAESVVWAPVASQDGRSFPRPSLPYVTLQITTPPRDVAQSSRDTVTWSDEDLADTLGITTVEAQQNAPPGSPADGDVYLVGAAPSGTWIGHANTVATYDGDTSTWTYATPATGDRVWTSTEDSIRYSGAAWITEDELRVERVTAHRPFTLTINAYARSSTASQGAAWFIDRCCSTLHMDATLDALSAAGLGSASVLATRNLDALVGEAFESREAADIQFRVVVRDTAATDTIDTITAEGTVSTLSVPVTIDLGA